MSTLASLVGAEVEAIDFNPIWPNVNEGVAISIRFKDGRELYVTAHGDSYGGATLEPEVIAATEACEEETG